MRKRASYSLELARDKNDLSTFTFWRILSPSDYAAFFRSFELMGMKNARRLRIYPGRETDLHEHCA
ncbi:MAG: hypothetical protein WCA11_17870, partial [Terracidiphilus sp.]